MLYKPFSMSHGDTHGDAETRLASFQIPLDLYRRLELLAERHDRSVSAVLRLAVRDYLANHDAESLAA
jgi:predicted transcriptional regulator